MTLLAVEKISKKFKDQIILESVSFTINSNEIIGLVGKNGIGKTTLLEISSRKNLITWTRPCSSLSPEPARICSRCGRR